MRLECEAVRPSLPRAKDRHTGALGKVSRKGEKWEVGNSSESNSERQL